MKKATSDRKEVRYMAIYSLNMSSVNRSKGSNACKTLSYITGEKVYDERLGQTHNYGRNERVDHHAMILPNGATFKSEIELINSIEQYETSDSSVIAKKIMVALPIEFSKEQDIELVEKLIKDNFTSNNYACVYALHGIGTNNPHAHILVVARELDEQGQWKQTKAKKVNAIYEDGHKFEKKRIPTLDPSKIEQYELETGKTFKETDFDYDELCDKFQKLGSRNRKQWKRVNAIKNKITEKAFLKELRADWSAKCNELLPTDKKIDHRSFKERGIDDMEPTIHKGYKTTAIENKGGWNKRLERYTDIQTANYETSTDKSFISRNLRILKENINDRIRTFETRFTELGTRIGELRERATERFRSITQLRESTETRQSRIEELTRRTTERLTRIKELKNEIRMDRKRISSIEEWTISPQVDQEKSEFYFEHITQWAIRERGETFFVLNWMLENDDNFNQWANSLSHDEWVDFNNSIYAEVDEKMKEVSIPTFAQETIYEMVQDISKRYWNSVTDGSSAISELCDENEQFNQYINSLSEQDYDELVAKADEIVDQERDELY